MFGQDAAACCDVASKQGLSSAALTLPASPMVGGRTVAFPMKDAYSPVSNARVPATGLNAWPYRKELGRQYYGLNGLRGSRGMGEGPPPFYDPTLDPVYVSGSDPSQLPTYGHTPPIFSTQGVTLPQPSILQQILNSLGTILPNVPAIISSAEGNPYYNPAQLGQQRQTVLGVPVQQSVQQTGPGSTAQIGATLGASVGNIFNSLSAFVTTNPLLVLGGGAALFLLMREPPRRR